MTAPVLAVPKVRESTTLNAKPKIAPTVLMPTELKDVRASSCTGDAPRSAETRVFNRLKPRCSHQRSGAPRSTSDCQQQAQIAREPGLPQAIAEKFPTAQKRALFADGCEVLDQLPLLPVQPVIESRQESPRLPDVEIDVFPGTILGVQPPCAT